MQQRSVKFGDEDGVWETAAQAGAKGAEAATLTRPDARRGQAPASFTFGSAAPEYGTTAAAASALAASATGPRAAPAAKIGSVIVLGDDAVSYVSNRMSEDGSQTKTLKQRFIPRVPALKSA